MNSEPPPVRRGRRPSLCAPTVQLPAGPISKAAFARVLGCSKSRVTEWVRERVITAPGVTAAGMIVPALAIEQMHAASCFAAGNGRIVHPAADAVAKVAAVAESGEGRSLTYDEARTATETLRAHKALLDLRARRLELVETAIAEAVLFAAARAFRDGLAMWPVRVVPEMAARLGVPPAALLLELETSLRTFLAGLADPRADWRQDRR